MNQRVAIDWYPVAVGVDSIGQLTRVRLEPRIKIGWNDRYSIQWISDEFIDRRVVFLDARIAEIRMSVEYGTFAKYGVLPAFLMAVMIACMLDL